mgnify:FL=1
MFHFSIFKLYFLSNNFRTDISKIKINLQLLVAQKPFFVLIENETMQKNLVFFVSRFFALLMKANY